MRSTDTDTNTCPYCVSVYVCEKSTYKDTATATGTGTGMGTVTDTKCAEGSSCINFIIKIN